MGSMGRFVSVAFPLYLVVGRLLAMLPAALGGVLLAMSAVLLAVYAALASAGYAIF